MTATKYKELADALYQRTIDFIQEECQEMCYEMDLIEETNDKAFEIMNGITANYFSHYVKKQNS